MSITQQKTCAATNADPFNIKQLTVTVVKREYFVLRTKRSGKVQGVIGNKCTSLNVLYYFEWEKKREDSTLKYITIFIKCIAITV